MEREKKKSVVVFFFVIFLDVLSNPCSSSSLLGLGALLRCYVALHLINSSLVFSASRPTNHHSSTWYLFIRGSCSKDDWPL